MPATQSVEFGASAGQTVTAKLFAAGSDTVVQTASAVTAATNRTGVYTATFTDVAAGTYRLIATNAAGTLLAQWWVKVALVTGTYISYEMPADMSPTAAETATAVRTELSTELGRIDTAVSSRMATYTQPTGFLAATFPATVSSFAGGAVASVTAAVTVGTNNDKSGYSLTAGTGLGNQTANITGNLSGSVGSVTGAVGSVTNRVTANTDQWGGVTVTGMPMPTYTQPAGFLTATFPATVSSYAGGAVASVTGNVGGNVAGSVGSISGVTFPTNFGALLINSSGHVSRVVLVDTTTTNTDMRGTDGAALASSWTATRAGYLDSVLLAQNSNQRTVQVTGSNHISADVHAFQPDVIDSAAIAASAVTELQSGLATAANLLIVSDRVSYSLAVLVGACSDAQTAAETYTLSIGGNTFTVDYSGLDSTGNRSTTTLSKA